jgi:hypothetical protein
MELAQDWRLYQTITRGKRGRAAPLARNGSAPFNGESTTIACVISGVETPSAQILAIRSADEGLQTWVGLPLQEFRNFLGDSRELCVISVSTLRDSFQLAEKSTTWFEQRRAFRDALHRLVPSGKGQVGVPRSKEQRHFLLSAFSSGALKRLFPKNFLFWIRFQEGVNSQAMVQNPHRDELIWFREGEVLGCGPADLSSLGPDRMVQTDWVARHLSEKHVQPVQGLIVSPTSWESWVDADRPWKLLHEALRQGDARLEPAILGLKLWIQLKAWFG